MNLQIRTETAADFERIERVIIAAFSGAEHSDGDEHNLVKRLRHSSGFQPELALVAEEAGEIVGHILFTPIVIRGARGQETASLALAPVSVHPDFQGRGIGGALIGAGHDAAMAKGYTSVILLGHESYYPRFGYKPAALWGIKAPFDVPEEAFMAIELVEGALCDSAGSVVYPPAFGV